MARGGETPAPGADDPESPRVVVEVNVGLIVEITVGALLVGFILAYYLGWVGGRTSKPKDENEPKRKLTIL